MKFVKEFVSRKLKREFTKMVTEAGEDIDKILDAQDFIISEMTGKTKEELQEIDTKEYEQAFYDIKKLMEYVPWDESDSKDKK